MHFNSVVSIESLTSWERSQADARVIVARTSYIKYSTDGFRVLFSIEHSDTTSSPGIAPHCPRQSWQSH